MTTATLLGYLARFSSFSTQAEVLCTQGLTYLLQTHEDARSVVADEVMARTGVGIADAVTWLAEAKQKEGARPDLEARAADDTPMVKVEAKLGAELFPEQLRSYVADLRERNSGDAALLVLVPRSRVEEACRVAAETFGLSETGPWSVTDGHRTGMAVISWEEIFAVLRGCKTERLCHELDQLEGMYNELSGNFIAPLASESDLREWRSCETDFAKLVDQVTRRLTKQHRQHRLYPWQVESYEPAAPELEPVEYQFRYVCPCASCYSIGVRDSFAKWVTPIWMRLHKDTKEFRHIRQRVKSSRVRSLDSHGHLWIPLQVPPEVSGKQMVQELVEQVEEILQFAFPTE